MQNIPSIILYSLPYLTFNSVRSWLANRRSPWSRTFCKNEWQLYTHFHEYTISSDPVLLQTMSDVVAWKDKIDLNYCWLSSSCSITIMQGWGSNTQRVFKYKCKYFQKLKLQNTSTNTFLNNYKYNYLKIFKIHIRIPLKPCVINYQSAKFVIMKNIFLVHCTSVLQMLLSFIHL